MEAKPKTESQLRDAESYWPKTPEELVAYISTLTGQQHDYGTCVYAMSLSAVAAFNYVASKLGTTGFQSSCADLDILRRTRLLKGPFMIVKAEDALYPQHDLLQKVAEFIGEQKEWLAKEAREKIDKHDMPHPEVLQHWIRLATPSGEQISEDDCRYLGLCVGLQSDRSEEFVEKRAKDFLHFGIEQIYIYGEGNPALADSVKAGGMHRINMPVGLEFTRNIGGVEVTWTVDTEKDGSNGADGYRFDWEKLEALAATASENCKPAILEYIAKAKEAA